MGFCFSDGASAYCACPEGWAPYEDGSCAPTEGCAGITCSGRGTCEESAGRAVACICEAGARPSPDGFNCLPDGDGDVDADTDVDGDADGDGDGDLDTDLLPDSDPDLDGDGATLVGYVARVGADTCQGTETVIEVSEPVPAGETLVASIGFRRAESGPVTVADSGENPYARREGAGDPSAVAVEVWSAPVLTALSPGDTIQVTHPAGVAVLVVIERFEGIAADPGDVDPETGSTAILAASVDVAEAPALLYAAAVSVNHLDLAPGPPLSALLAVDASCGGTSKEATSHGAWAVVDEPGVFECSGTLSADQDWAMVLLAFPAAR